MPTATAHPASQHQLPAAVNADSSKNPAYEDQWLFTQNELLLSPSIQAGMSAAEERQCRAKGVNFILQVGILLKLPQITLSTASVYLHRFFMRNSMKKDPTGRKPDFHYYSVAAASLWLAAKVEENCRKMKEVVVACVRVAQKNPNKTVDEQDKEFWKWRDTILALEDKLLESLCFDLSLEPPYFHLYEYMKVLDVQENKEFRNAAWAFINDSVMTPICLLYPARVIAAASIYAAARRQGLQFADDKRGRPWWEGLDVSIGEIKKACNFMADVYEDAPLRSGAAEGMYTRTPEETNDTTTKTRAAVSSSLRQADGGAAAAESADDRSVREASVLSTAGSDMSRKRGRDEDNGQHQPASINDVPWGGSEAEREAKRPRPNHHAPQRPPARPDVEMGDDGGAGQHTNEARSNGRNGLDDHGVPLEAGPAMMQDRTPVPAEGEHEYTGPVSPDLAGSEEGEI